MIIRIICTTCYSSNSSRLIARHFTRDVCFLMVYIFSTSHLLFSLLISSRYSLACLRLHYFLTSVPPLFYPILSYSILPHTILSYPILFYSLLFYPILPSSILSYTILFYPILFFCILPYSILFYFLVSPSFILFYPIIFFTFLFSTVLSYVILLSPHTTLPFHFPSQFFIFSFFISE